MHQHLREIMTQECQVPCWLVGRSMLMGLSLNQWEDFFKEMLFVDFVNLGSNIKVKRSPPIAWNLESSCMIIPQISPLVHKDWDGNFPKFLWILFCAGILTGINLPVTNYLGSAEPNCAIHPSQINQCRLGKPEIPLTTWRYHTSGKLDDNKKILKLRFTSHFITHLIQNSPLHGTVPDDIVFILGPFNQTLDIGAHLFWPQGTWSWVNSCKL